MIPSCWNWSRWKSASCWMPTTFPGDDTPIIIGSALKALEGDDERRLACQSAIIKLVEALDSYIPEPERATDQPIT